MTQRQRHLLWRLAAGLLGSLVVYLLVKMLGPALAIAIVAGDFAMARFDTLGRLKMQRVVKLPRYMMATRAIGGGTIPIDLTREEPSLCLVWEYDAIAQEWIGAWETGYGFTSVRFPLATTRDLNVDEIDMYRARATVMGNNEPMPALDPKYAVGRDG